MSEPNDPSLPVLHEVVFAEPEEGENLHLFAPNEQLVEPGKLSGAELKVLIETLVERRLATLRSELTEEIIDQLARAQPGLFKE